MMYKNDFVAVVKENGKILREHGNTVFLPFGCEYSILMKNLRSKNVLVSISIDGEDVLNGNSLIINGNSELELERFLEFMSEGNKFKFIQKTSKIQEYRRDKVDDGIIRIEFQYEENITKQQKPIIWSNTFKYKDKNVMWTSASTDFNCLRGTSDITTCCYNHSPSNVVLDGTINNASEPLYDEGITVKGSMSNQKFAYGSIGKLEPEKHVITLQLKGSKENGDVVNKPLTVKTKQECSTCGTKNDSKNKFCIECGTFLS